MAATRTQVENALAAGNGIFSWISERWLALLALKFFGADVNPDVPMIPRFGNWPGSGR
jgi:hypothetical protein